MTRKLGISMVVLVVATVVTVGVTSFACGGKTQTSAQPAFRASSGQCPAGCPYGSGAMTQCPYLKQMHVRSASDAQMTSNSCGSSASFGANIYEVCNGHNYAVCQGRVFEVTANTPYLQVGNARYYLDDPYLGQIFQSEPAQLTSELDREAVTLATADGNVVGTENGQKIAQCPLTGKTFLVTSDSPVRVMDGQRFYLSDTVDLATVSNAMHK